VGLSADRHRDLRRELPHGRQGLHRGHDIRRGANPVCALDSKEPGFWNLIDSTAMNCSWGKPGKEPLAIDWTSTMAFRPPYGMPAMSRAQAGAIVQTPAGLLPPRSVVTLLGAMVPQPQPEPQPERAAKEDPAEPVPPQEEAQEADLAPIVAALDKITASIQRIKR
jgi:hypothetical protein